MAEKYEYANIKDGMTKDQIAMIKLHNFHIKRVNDVIENHNMTSRMFEEYKAKFNGSTLMVGEGKEL